MIPCSRRDFQHTYFITHIIIFRDLFLWSFLCFMLLLCNAQRVEDKKPTGHQDETLKNNQRIDKKRNIKLKVSPIPLNSASQEESFFSFIIKEQNSCTHNYGPTKNH